MSRLGSMLLSLQHVVEAYGHLHDLDWLQDSPLTGLEAVRERTNPLAPMPQAQALPAMPTRCRFRRLCTCSSRASSPWKQRSSPTGSR